LKRYGGIWNTEKKIWVFPSAANQEHLRTSILDDIEDDNILERAAALKREEQAKEERKKARAATKALKLWKESPEGKAALALEEREKVRQAKAAGTHWICCEECEVIDWKRQFTSCKIHCVDHGGGWIDSFRVRGCIYTGD
jgi:hypothetical protein